MNWRAFRALLTAQIQRSFTYRIDAVMWIVNGLIWPLVMIAFWSKIAESSPQSLMSRNDIIVYFLLSALVERITQTWSADWIAESIQEGSFSKQLLRPINYLIEDLSDNLAHKVQRLTFLIPFLLLIAIAYRDSFHLNMGVDKWILFIAAGVLGFVVRFWFENTLGLLAFFFTEIDGIAKIYNTITGIFRGSIIPLILLPPSLHLVGTALYTRYLISFPLEIILGQVQGEAIISGFLLGVIWVLFFVAVQKIIWVNGLRRYTAVGI